MNLVINMYDFDVVIVGAGINGSFTGMIAANKGLNVLIVDKKNELASPLRGGEAFCKPYYDYLSEKFSFLKEIPKWDCDGTVMYSKDTKIVNKEPKWLAYVLERRVFEKRIGVEAILAGCQMWLASNVVKIEFEKSLAKRVVLETNEGIKKVSFKVLIGADGYASFVRRKLGYLGVNKDLGPALEIEMANIDFIENNKIQIFVGQVPGGYAYIFPKGNKRGNTGVGMRPLVDKRAKKPPIFYFNKAIKEIPLMKKQLLNAQVTEIKGGCIDVAGPIKFVHKNILLVGDSANQNFSYVGEGILPGMIAGEICADCVFDFIKSNNQKDLDKYEPLYFEDDIGLEVLETIKIKDAINLVLSSSKDISYKQFLTAMLEMEVIKHTDIDEAMKNKGLDELILYSKKLIKKKKMKINIKKN
jgi:digeranylgeranylglycerophospholipid reductase